MSTPANSRSLPAQMITAFIAVVLLASATVGLPAIWLIRKQLDQQAWAQVEQGQRTAIALYAAQQREVDNLATLIAQRPTLHALIENADGLALADYLRTLEDSTELDWIAVCAGPTSLASVPQSMAEYCARWETGGYHLAGQADYQPIWLTARLPLQAFPLDQITVQAGRRLDQIFANEMRTKTGLEHFLCLDGQPSSASFSDGITGISLADDCTIGENGDGAHFTFELQSRPYYGAYLPLDASGLNAAIILDVTDNAGTQNRLAGILIAGVLGISLAGSAIGIFLARSISRPLVRLADAATKFASGDLQTPVNIDAHVYEVVQVAQALENARRDLRETLTSLEVERDWSENLLASIVEGIITLDGENRLTYFSHGAERITGWSRAEVLGRPCNEVFQVAHPGKTFTSIIPETGGRGKADLLLAGGRQASLAITRAELAPSKAQGAQIVLVFRDISEEEAVHRLLGHFLANVAHEFRTPLSALAASIELLLDQARDLSPDELSELLNNLHLGTLGLQTLVDNLLESASIEAGRFHVSPRAADLDNIIAEATRIMQPLLDKYGQRLVFKLPVYIPIVQADPRRMTQVLVNLLNNASKYGPADAEIELSIHTTALEARVAVADHGPGVPAQGKADVFRRFIYPDTLPQTAQAGAGLGLSVVKAIVEAHGGQVGVDDRPGGGSIFWFSLTLAGENL